MGDNVEPAEVAFKAGLNIIAGASNTGKSYVFQAINYMLGGTKPPKSVKEDAGYDGLLMELQTPQGTSIVLERSLKRSGDFRVFPVGLDAWAPGVPHKEMLAKNEPDNTNTVPHFVLSLCDMVSVKVRKNEKGETRRIGSRDLCHFSMISEKRIIDETTPTWPTGQIIFKTADREIFNYLVSGEHAGSVVTVASVRERKVGWRAKSELYDELISELEGDVDGADDDIPSQIELIDASLEEATVEVGELTSRLQHLLEQRRDAWQELQRANARIATISQLTERFELLNEHYKTDTERLRFVSEADGYLSQLGQGHCPICGALLEDHDAQQLSDDHETRESIQQSVSREIEKLELHLEDLGTTMQALQTERLELEQLVAQRRSSINEWNQEMQTNLEPVVADTRNELKALHARRTSLVVLQHKRDRLEALRSKRVSLGAEPKQSRKKKEKKTSSTAENRGRRAFCDALEERLRNWSFPDIGTVAFDSDDDVLIDGVARRSNGKGIMAIIHSAFTVTLMSRFRERHAGVVILDSPLTSYKEKDRQEVAQDIQYAFYLDLMRTPNDQQLIVLENKEPPEHIIDVSNYCHFSGSADVGRAGFYPSL